MIKNFKIIARFNVEHDRSPRVSPVILLFLIPQRCSTWQYLVHEMPGVVKDCRRGSTLKISSQEVSRASTCRSEDGSHLIGDIKKNQNE